MPLHSYPLRSLSVTYALSIRLEEVYQDPNFEGFGTPCDSILRTDDGTEFQVHRAVLSAKSEFFRGLFSTYDDGINCTVIHDIKPDVFEAILIYLCTGRIDLNEKNMMHILVAADFLMIDSLLCEARVFAMKNKSVLNCIELLVTSYRIKDLDMINQCSRFLLIYFERALKSSEYDAYKLPSNILMYFLRHKSINVSKEHFLWSFIKKWVQKDADNRLPMVPELLKCLYMDEIDEKLASDIISSKIIQKHVQCKDFRDSLPADNKSRLMTLVGENIQFIPGARRPPCVYLVTKKIPGNYDAVDMFMTYDDRPDVWRKMGAFPFPSVKLFLTDHKVYIFSDHLRHVRGYYDVSDIGRAYVYDFSTNLVTVIDLRPHPGLRDFVVESSGRIYALGTVWGIDWDLTVKVWFYVDKDEWQEISPMQPMCYAGAVSSNGLLYVIGIQDAGMFMQVYHPSSDEWKTASPPHIHRTFMTVVEYRGRIFLVGGWYPQDAGHFCRGVEAYDPARDEWSLYPPLPFNLSTSYKCGVVRGRLYVFDNGGPVYWDDSGEWKTTPSFQNYTFCSIEGQEAVSEIMKKNRKAKDWQESPLGNIFE